MSKPGVRMQRNIVNNLAQRGYDNVHRLDKKCNDLKSKPASICSHDSCSVKLSMYNDTDFCSQHQKENIPLSKFF